MIEITRTPANAVCAGEIRKGRGEKKKKNSLSCDVMSVVSLVAPPVTIISSFSGQLPQGRDPHESPMVTKETPSETKENGTEREKEREVWSEIPVQLHNGGVTESLSHTRSLWEKSNGVING